MLAPPTAALALRLHPRSHPGNQKSTIDWEGDYAAAAAAAAGDSLAEYMSSRGVPGVQEVELGPGDMLYLPPTTFHHVRSMPPPPPRLPQQQQRQRGDSDDFSAAVNLWTFGAEFLAYEQLLSSPLPCAHTNISSCR